MITQIDLGKIVEYARADTGWARPQDIASACVQYEIEDGDAIAIGCGPHRMAVARVPLCEVEGTFLSRLSYGYPDWRRALRAASEPATASLYASAGWAWKDAEAIGFASPLGDTTSVPIPGCPTLVSARYMADALLAVVGDYEIEARGLTGLITITEQRGPVAVVHAIMPVYDAKGLVTV